MGAEGRETRWFGSGLPACGAATHVGGLEGQFVRS